MKLQILKKIVLMACVLSALTITAACPKRTSNCGKSRRTSVTRNYQSSSCAKVSLKTSGKSRCCNKTTVVIRKKAKGCRSVPLTPGRYRVRFERHSFTNGLEQIEFRRPVRTRY